jgi:ATP adenylyltransferase
MVMLNKYPYNSGHLLVLPQRHVGDLTELTREENETLAALMQKSVKILKQIYNCDGLNLGMNHGAVSGAGIPQHLHWHVIPRWSGDTNFFPLIAETKALPETLEQTYNNLVKPFQEALR